MKAMPKAAFLLLFLAFPLFAVDEIYTWGYGRQMHDLLRAVSMLTGNANDSLIKVAVGIGGLVLTFKLAANSKNAAADIGKFVAMTIFVVQFFWVVKGDFIVRDQTNNFVSPVVLSLPQGVGTTFSLFSKLENGLAQAFETNFSTPNSISYQKAGLGFMMSAHLGMDSLSAQDPSLIRTFNEYLDNCLLNSAAMGNLDISSLQNSKDLISALAVNEAWLTPVYHGTSAASMMQCTDAWTDIKSRIPADASNAVGIFAKSFGQLSAADVQSKLGDVAQTMFSSAAISTSSYINQMSLMNMYSEGMQAVAMSTASDLSSVATANAIAQSSTKAGWIQAGLQAKRTLPMQKAFLTMISVVLLMLMSLYAIAMVDFSGIKQMFQLLFVYVMWTPLTIVINYLTYSTIESVVSGMSGSDLPTLLSKAAISNETQSYLAFLGYSISLVTAMAFMLVTKNGLTFVNAVTSAGMSASTLRAAEAAGGLGNFSHGNVNNQNTSVGNTNKFGKSYYGNDIAGQGDGYSVGMSGGVMQYQTASAGTTHRTAGGGTVDAKFEGDRTTQLTMDGYGVDNISKNVSKVASRELARSESLQENAMVQASDAIAKAYKQAVQSGTTEKTAKSFGISVEQMESMAKDYTEATDHAYKEARTNKDSFNADNKNSGKVETSVGGSIGIGNGANSVGASVSAKGETSQSHTHSTGTDKSNATEFSQSEKEAINKKIASALKNNSSYMNAFESTVSNMNTSENSKTHQDAYTKSKQYTTAKQATEKLAADEKIASGLSQNINTQVFDNLAEKHGKHTADEKLEFYKEYRDAIVLKDDKDKQKEVEREAYNVMARSGLSTGLIKTAEQNLVNTRQEIAEGKSHINNQGGHITSNASSGYKVDSHPRKDDDFVDKLGKQYDGQTAKLNADKDLMGSSREQNQSDVYKNADKQEKDIGAEVKHPFGPLHGMAGAASEVGGNLLNSAYTTPSERRDGMSHEAKRGLIKESDSVAPNTTAQNSTNATPPQTGFNLFSKKPDREAAYEYASKQRVSKQNRESDKKRGKDEK